MGDSASERVDVQIQGKAKKQSVSCQMLLTDLAVPARLSPSTC